MSNSVLIAINKKSKFFVFTVFICVWMLLFQYLAVVMHIDGYVVT